MERYDDGFAEERQRIERYHLESDVSNLIVNHKQQLDELQLLKMIKGQE